jgi:hypothetical protein
LSSLVREAFAEALETTPDEVPQKDIKDTLDALATSGVRKLEALRDVKPEYLNDPLGKVPNIVARGKLLR